MSSASSTTERTSLLQDSAVPQITFTKGELVSFDSQKYRWIGISSGSQYDSVLETTGDGVIIPTRTSVPTASLKKVSQSTPHPTPPARTTPVTPPNTQASRTVTDISERRAILSAISTLQGVSHPDIRIICNQLYAHFLQ